MIIKRRTQKDVPFYLSLSRIFSESVSYTDCKTKVLRFTTMIILSIIIRCNETVLDGNICQIMLHPFNADAPLESKIKTFPAILKYLITVPMIFIFTAKSDSQIRSHIDYKLHIPCYVKPVSTQ